MFADHTCVRATPTSITRCAVVVMLACVIGYLHAGYVQAQTASDPSFTSTATVVTTCTQAGLQAALNTGGLITFNCGAPSTTIAISSVLTTNGRDTEIDGGGRITLDGQGQTKILNNPYSPNPRTLTIRNMRFINGKAPATGGIGIESGGAITSGSPGTRLHIINSTFENNSTSAVTNEDNQGGAIFSNNSYETVIVNSVFRNNRAGSGGAIGIIASGLLIYDSQFIDNQAVDTTGGGIVRGYGGAIHLDGVWNDFNPNANKTIYVSNTRFEGNTAIRGGGAFGSVISDNAATKATFINATFVNNEAKGVNGQYGQGGALYHIEDDEAGGRNEDNFEIRGSTFAGNKALRQGGGVWVQILGRGRVVNSTFAANTTTAPLNEVGQGGAMMITKGVIDITSTTFANNHAAYQGGALHAGGANDPDRVVTLSNTIFANNTLNEQTQPSETRWQGYHTNRPMSDGGQNIQFPRFKPTYNNDVNNNITANPLYVDPLLQPLAANGGPTPTMAIAANSPARDAGNPATCPGADQRGYLRNGRCDIGAYEASGAPFVPKNVVRLPLVRR